MDRNKALGLWLFVLAFVAGAYFYPGGGQNEAARYDTIRAVLEDQTFVVDKYTYNSADLISYNMHFYSSKAPGTFFLGLIPFAVSETVLKFFPIENNQRLKIVCYLTSIFSVTLFAALCAPLIFFLLLRIGANQGEAFTVALSISLATILFPFSTVFFSHAATASFSIISFYLLYADYQKGLTVYGRKKRALLFLAGFAAGFTILLEYPAAIIALALLLYGAWVFQERRQFRDFTFVLFGFLGSIVLMMLYNYLSFNDAFFIPYEAYAHDTNPIFEAHKHGILGVRIPFLEPEFRPIFWANLKEITYRPLRGIFFCNPILLFIFPGFFWFFREKTLRKEAFFVFILVVAYFCFNASYGDSVLYWGGGASFGPRHLIPILPLLSLPLYFAFKQKYLRPLFLIAAMVSFFFCLMAASVEPRAPYSPNNILLDYYLPHFLKGDLGITKEGIFSGILAEEPGYTAFSWGSLLGLPPLFKLLPLYIFLLAVAWYLERKFRIHRLFPFALLVFTIIFGAPFFYHAGTL